MKTDDPLLTAYALGESLTAEEHHRVEAALASDPELRDTVEAIRQTAHLLDTALGDEPMPRAKASARAEAPEPAAATDSAPAWRPGQHLSPSARRARIARFEKEAPVLGGLSRKTGNKTHYGAYGAIMAACLALVGLTVFRTVADRFDQMDAESTFVEVEPLNPEDLEFDSPFAQAIARQVAEQLAEQEAMEQALAVELAAANLDQPSAQTLPTLDAFRMSDRLLDEPLPPAPPAMGTGLSTTRIPARNLIPASDFRPELPAGVEMSAVRSEPEPIAIPYPDRQRPSAGLEMTALSASAQPLLSGAGTLLPPQVPDSAPFIKTAGAEGFVSTQVEPSSRFPLEGHRDSDSISNVFAQGEGLSADAVRIGAWVNAFRYAPEASAVDDGPVSILLEAASAPWASQHRLVRVLIQTAESTDDTAGMVVARDAYAAVEFNPQVVDAYRLIGYEDVAQAGAPAHHEPLVSLQRDTQITALYEVVPVGGEWVHVVEPASALSAEEAFHSGKELMRVELRYTSVPSGEDRQLVRALSTAEAATVWGEASDDFRWVVAVAGFGLLLQGNADREALDWALLEDLARSALGEDRQGQREDFLQLMEFSGATFPRDP